MTNQWQGAFPWRNDGAKGWRGTSPVATFPPNGFGLYDMCGNTWEWTTDFFSPRGAGVPDPKAQAAAKPCCGPPRNPRVDSPDSSYDFGNPGPTSPAVCSRAARTCARPSTACAIGPPLGTPKRSTRRPPTSASAARPTRLGPRPIDPPGRQVGLLACLGGSRGHFAEPGAHLGDIAAPELPLQAPAPIAGDRVQGDEQQRRQDDDKGHDPAQRLALVEGV